MKIEDFTISVIVSVSLVIGFFSVFAWTANSYSLYISDQFNSESAEAAMKKIQSIQEEMHSSILGVDDSQTTEQTNDPDKNNVGFWGYTKAAFKSVYLNMELVGPVLTLITGAGLFLKVNVLVITTVISVLIFGLVFALVAFIKNRRA